MRPVDRPVPLRDALLVLGTWALLAPAQCFQGHPLWRYSSSEVVIPKKEVQHGRVLQMPGRLSYSLSFGGQKHVIHLWRKDLLWPRRLQLTTQDDQGALQMDYPYFPGDCYYLGHLEEVPLSMATIETCSGGLEGIMKLDDLAYEITPLKDSRSFEHTVSQIVADISATGPTYNLDHQEDLDPLFPEANFSAAPRISSFLYSSHRGNIKGHVQCTNTVYKAFNNVSDCVRHLISMFALVDSYFRNIDFGFYISMVIVYNVNDPVPIDDYRVPKGTYHNYYVKNFYDNFHPHATVALLQSGPHEKDFNPTVEGMCTADNLIYTSRLQRHYLLLSIICTNQLSRLYGIPFDESDCVCQRRNHCIMHRYPGITDAFSNCSFVHFQNIAQKVGIAACYYESNKDLYNRTLTERFCGDTIVEDEELCDCGTLKECYSNECCQANCRFKPGSICDKETCCANCTYAPAGTLCRTIQNICDLPEYCLGSSVKCPTDIYLQNGTPCTEEGYCYNGNCTDRNMQCKEIFGAYAMEAAYACYQINTAKFRFGNCGREPNRNEYKSCSDEDKMCGRLQCSNITELPQLQEHVSFHQSLLDGSLCFGLDEHRATGTTDAGQVRPGTPCVTGYYCTENACKGQMKGLDYDCRPEKCHHRGVCNSKKNCHCHMGWEPPQCLKPGAGGSQDSGPTPRRMRSVTQSTDVVLYLRVVVGRIYAMLAALLLGVATNVRRFKTIKVEEEESLESEQKPEEEPEPEPVPEPEKAP